jgi:hypothetical protein
VAKVVIDIAAGDAANPVSLNTGERHVIIIKRPRLELTRLYHDDRPVQGASFTVELTNGRKVQGKLDAEGNATVALPGLPSRVQFGPDRREWVRVDQTKNEDFQDQIDVDSFVEARFQASQVPAGPDDDSDSA